jgi:hypothetical protein
LNPNSRKGRVKRSPFLQGRDTMENKYVGIDVSKDKQDVHVLPSGEYETVVAAALAAAVWQARPEGRCGAIGRGAQ